MKRQEFHNHLDKLGLTAHDPNKMLYKYTNIKDANTILSDATLFYQTPSEFNDPFEMHAGLLNILGPGIEHFTNWLSLKNYTPSQIEKILQFAEPSQLKTTLSDTLHNKRNDYGVLCLSKKNDNTLMWSHYADKHKGVCLGFKFPSPKASQMGFEVKYLDKIEPIEILLEPGIESKAKLIHWICSKSNAWSYEQEVRFINFKNKGAIGFDKSQLCEIYFGVSTSQDDVDVLNEKIKTLGYNIQRSGKMMIQKSDFLLGIEPL